MEAIAPVAEVQTLKNRYDYLASDRRQSYLERGRSCAALTLPSILPPEGHTGSSPLPTPWQSVGARGVNHLCAKLLMALLPANSPFFKLTIDEYVLERLTEQPELRAEIDAGLAKYERSIMGTIESMALRVAIFETLKHLVVVGNVAVFLHPQGGVRVFRLDRYVAKRDPMGNLLDFIAREDVSPMELDGPAKQALYASGYAPKQSPEAKDCIEIYTRVYRDGQFYLTYQEINGARIEGSEGKYPLDKSPWLVLRWTEVDNEDYGRGMVEEYFGDLQSLEALRKAIVQGAVAAAKVLFLIRPNSTTKARVLAESESGAIRDGNAEDVTVLQMDKYNDFRVALELSNEIRQTLSLAFLLNTALQRSGERVTAEEIRFMAEELESSLGGIYSSLSQTLQRPLVSRLMHQGQARGELPQLPEGVVKVNITTGIDALGRSNDLARLKAFSTDLTQVAQLAELLDPYLNIQDLITRLGTGYNISTEGLIPTEEESAERLKARQQAAMMAQLGPNLVNKGGDLMRDAMAGGASSE